ncbi:hypothetical protein E1301_Tti017993 [Triplophysa tibetana]|uniref:Uncharacterized protein n=1 Tax=Triplophysa tibetana TaxID=1572043 RepID=A0A5A9NLI7_9TELE|nr:hypothetical protein E1301_Tti017993 [Triplophysa tibetana]
MALRPGAARLLVFVAGGPQGWNPGSVSAFSLTRGKSAGRGERKGTDGETKCKSDNTSSITFSSFVSRMGFFHTLTELGGIREERVGNIRCDGEKRPTVIWNVTKS